MEDIPRWPPYHWIDSSPEPILKSFWEAAYDEADIEDHLRFIRMLSLRKQGMRDSDIQRALAVTNAGKYISGKKKSFVTHLRAEHDRLGPPKEGLKWLPIRIKPRGTPDKTWIQVPTAIRDYSDILSVLDQLTPTEESYKMMEQFGYRSRDELIQDKANHFGFFVGVMLGDASKGLRSESRFPSVTVAMMLSKDKKNSERFVEFTALSANNSLGLLMHRIRDAPTSEGRFTKAECFRWITPVSPLIAWVSRVAMGYKRGERTTYDPMRADWLLTAPASFQIHFLQGLAESDGWVNPGDDMVEIVSSPNEHLLDALLDSLNIPHRFQVQYPITRVEFDTTDGLRLPVFNEKIHSVNYENLVTMATAQRFPERTPLPGWFLTKIQPILSSPIELSQACLEIAKKTGYKIAGNTVKKYRAQKNSRSPSST